MINKPSAVPVFWYKEFYVWMILFFPALAVVAGIYTIYLAVMSNDGLVVDDYYKQGLEINRSLERDKAALAHGLDSLLQINPERSQVRVHLNSSTGYILPAQVTLSLAHRTRQGFDQSITLNRIDTHLYSGALPKLSIRGRWNVQLEGEDWRMSGVLDAESSALRLHSEVSTPAHSAE